VIIIEEGKGGEIGIGRQNMSSKVSLTANEICDYYKLRNPKKPIGSDSLRKTYLNELVSADYIEALDVKEGNTKKAYYPIVSPLTEDITELSQEIEEFNTHPEFTIRFKINVPTEYVPLANDWLNFEVLRLWKCRIEVGDQHMCSCSNASYDSNSGLKPAIQFLDQIRRDGKDIDSSDSYYSYNNRKKITMTDFVQSYNRLTDILSRHFSRPIFDNYCNKIFGEIQTLGPTVNKDIINSGIDPNSSVSSVRARRLL
jgi:hypothetical protein